MVLYKSFFSNEECNGYHSIGVIVMHLCKLAIKWEYLFNILLLNTDQVGEQEEAPQEEAPRQLPIKKGSELGSAVVNGQGRSMNSPGSEQVPEAHVSNQAPDAVSNQAPDAVSNQALLPASGTTNNEGPENETRDTTGELDSREMEDGYSTDGTSVHETLMAGNVHVSEFIIG